MIPLVAGAAHTLVCMPTAATPKKAIGDQPAVENPRSRLALALAAVMLALLVTLAISVASSGAAVLTLKTVKVGKPGNRAVAIEPFTDAIYSSCKEATGEKECLMVGGVKYGYGIGQLEITVKQWVAFLNTADPTGKDPHHLYASSESSSAWPKYGEIDFASGAGKGHHYTVAFPEWAEKPYGFANFLRAARFINSLYNGQLLSKRPSSDGGFRYVTYKVRLSAKTESGMYKLSGGRVNGPGRSQKSGFVVPSQDEWIKAAYFDPSGGGTYSFWKYPTNAGVFGDGSATAPASTTLNPANGEVTNAATQPLSTYKSATVPTWCPSAFSPEACAGVNPFGLDPTTYAAGFQGSLSSVGQARTTSPWGTLDQGGNAVEWTDTIAPSPTGSSDGRVWRRLHGGIANAPAYQLWLSAVGLQPQDNALFTATYPWLGFRIGVVGNLKVGKG
jgi:hypothetical protein